ncbi:fatty acid hydroxylase [Pluteus cervinus]|uniref:Fatty acid hydroxylase n=1 Tax=Pluteus cervinus TaxID=181527 RepID=A0ACD3BAB5_9AGAR|nr:fatty acid hydroxylase [Pluteus cervinus]
MDLVLSVLDDLVLDRLWATLLPLSAFAVPETVRLASNSSSIFPVVASTSSKWSQMLAYVPHPPIRPDDLASISSTASHHLLTNISAWPRDYIPRQLISLSVITLVGVHILYFLFATLSYYFIFNHDMMRHPRFLKNQIKLEIQCSLRAFPGMTILTLPFFQGEVMGYTKLYDGLDTYGYWYLIASVPLFLVFTDYGIYWIHRGLHIPAVYKLLHKPHHKWVVPTPFSSHAFHPVDGWLQSIPYHIFILVFPLHRVLYLVLFVLINFWTIFIHDSDMITGHALEKIINGPAHHTLHHLYFTVNYGQYFTWADRAGGSYRQPDSSLDPLLDVHEADKIKLGKQQ